MKNIVAKVLISLGLLATITIISLILAYPLMLIWNWVMPAMFGLATITFWKMFWLKVLIGSLFKSSK